MATDLSQAARDVLAERQRQISVEGWTPEHDDEHVGGDLAAAGACYAVYSATYGCIGSTPQYRAGNPPWAWPFSPRWWKPKTGREDLVKAAAMMLAEIEKIDRAAAKEEAPHG
jgi:hypothetical protein